MGGELVFEHRAAHADALQRLRVELDLLAVAGDAYEALDRQRPAIKRDRHGALLPLADRRDARRALHRRRLPPQQASEKRGAAVGPPSSAPPQRRRRPRRQHRGRAPTIRSIGVAQRDAGGQTDLDRERPLAAGVDRRLIRRYEPMRRSRNGPGQAAPRSPRASSSLPLVVAACGSKSSAATTPSPTRERLGEQLCDRRDHERLAEVLRRHDAGGGEGDPSAERPAVRHRDQGAGELGDRQGDAGQGYRGEDHVTDHGRRHLLDRARAARWRCPTRRARPCSKAASGRSRHRASRPCSSWSRGRLAPHLRPRRERRAWRSRSLSLRLGATSGRRPPHGSRRPALATLTAVLFLTFLDTTIVSVALADVQSSLHAGVSQLQWVVNGYALTFAALMLAMGTLGDRLGRKRVMLGGLGVFIGGSLFGALAPSVSTAGRRPRRSWAWAPPPASPARSRSSVTSTPSAPCAPGRWASGPPSPAWRWPWGR